MDSSTWHRKIGILLNGENLIPRISCCFYLVIEVGKVHTKLDFWPPKFLNTFFVRKYCNTRNLLSRIGNTRRLAWKKKDINLMYIYKTLETLTYKTKDLVIVIWLLSINKSITKFTVIWSKSMTHGFLFHELLKLQRYFDGHFFSTLSTLMSCQFLRFLVVETFDVMYKMHQRSIPRSEFDMSQ